MRGLTYSLLAAYWMGCIIWYRKLPERYAIHFNAAGQPDRFAEGPMEWFLMPALATLTLAIVLGASRLARRAPQLWNIPEKKRFLALSDAQRAPIMDELEKIMDVVGAYTIALFIVVQSVIYRSALSSSGRMPVYFPILAIGGTLAIVVYAVATTRRIKDLILQAERHSGAGSQTS